MAGGKREFSLYRVLREQQTVRPVEPEADGLLAVVNGCPSDGGVMAELGIAIGWKKPAFPLRGDFRRWAESVGCPLNPTVFTGLPTSGWESRCYTLIDEPPDPDTALARWLGGS